MTKVKPTTKEQLVDFMLKYLSLGTYDKKFLNNLVQLNFIQKIQVTTNQADLLDKITLRYHRQLLKKELIPQEILLDQDNNGNSLLFYAIRYNKKFAIKLFKSKYFSEELLKLRNLNLLVLRPGMPGSGYIFSIYLVVEINWERWRIGLGIT